MVSSRNVLQCPSLSILGVGAPSYIDDFIKGSLKSFDLNSLQQVELLNLIKTISFLCRSICVNISKNSLQSNEYLGRHVSKIFETL